MACDNCQKGQFCDQIGQVGCKNCELGKVGSTPGLTSCALCDAGTYQNVVASTECKECGTGQYVDSAGQQTCKSCGAGKFQSGIGGECSFCSLRIVYFLFCFVLFFCSSKKNSCFFFFFFSFFFFLTRIFISSSPFLFLASTRGTPKYNTGTSCPGQCQCGYFCPAGSTHGKWEQCGEGNYCPSGTSVKNLLGNQKQGTPVDTNPARFCGQQACPTGFACADGVAANNLQWSSPLACKANSADSPYVVMIDEDSAASFGGQFKVTPHDTMDNQNYGVLFSITRWPGNAPTDCSGGRSKVGLGTEPSNNWLSVLSNSSCSGAVMQSGCKPSLVAKRLNTNAKLDAEACTLNYATQVTATLMHNGASVGQVSCYVNIVVSNVNEPPSVVTSSVSDRAVDETSLPGFAIGDPLQASDAEVNAGLQQLTWKIVTCYPFTFSRTGAGSWSTVDMMPNCHIKLSSCSGQLAVASVLNYETYTKYKIEIQGKHFL